MPSVSLASAGGSLGTATFNFNAEGTGRLDWLVNASVDRTDGQSGLTLSGPLASWTYGNRSARFSNLYWKLSSLLPRGGHVTAGGLFLDGFKRYGDELHFGQRQIRERNQQGFFLSAEAPAGLLGQLNVHSFLNRENEFLNVRFPENPAYKVHWGDQDRMRFGFRAGLFRPMGDRFAVHAGTQWERVRGRTDDDYVFFRYINHQTFHGSYLELEAAPWQGASLLAGGRVDGQTTVARLRPAWQLSLEQQMASLPLWVFVTGGKTNRWIPLNEVNTFLRPPGLLGPPFLATGFTPPGRSLDFEDFRSLETGLRFRHRLGAAARVSYFAHKNTGPTGTTRFQVFPIAPAPGIPPAYQAAVASFEGNVPIFERSRGIEADLKMPLRRGLELFSNFTRFLECDTYPRPGVTRYRGPLGGPAAQDFLNRSAGQMVIPGAERAMLPGAYDWLGNAGLLGSLGKRNQFNLISRMRGPTRDPIMKFGLDPGTRRIGGKSSGMPPSAGPSPPATNGS